MSKEADDVKGLYFPVLDHGFVALVDYMGDDAAIVQAARCSYGAGTKQLSEDRDLIRYLMRHKHTTPFEMVELKFHVKLPIFVARQLIRHRTACLTGDTLLHFDLPGGIERRGNQLYKMSIADVYKKFGKDERIGAMHLRSMNAETEEVRHTQIVDVWESGEKDVYRVKLTDGSSATMSKDHRCLTTDGWMTLHEAAKLPTALDPTWDCPVGFFTIGAGRDTGVVPQFNDIDEAMENWLPAIGWEEHYEVSDQGRVRRTVGGKGSRSFGRCKKVTVSGSHGVVSLNRPGYQATEHVHQMMLRAFVGEAPAEHMGRHKDGNGLNNRIENLCWSTQQDNADDRVRDGATTRLRSNTASITKITYVGRQMTYDLEVAGPWHNFSAGGMVVHNSVNEYSMRYSLPAMQFYMPPHEDMGTQSKKNKQGRAAPITRSQYDKFRLRLEHLQQESVELYEMMISKEVDLARELARMHLPLSIMTEWYWKIDLHNLLGFLKLRVDKHAQWEIQQVSQLKARIANLVAPCATEGWVDYIFQAKTFSRMEMQALRLMLTKSQDLGEEGLFPIGGFGKKSQIQALGMGKRELDEFMALFEHSEEDPFAPFDLSLDISLGKPGSYFEEQAKLYLPKQD